MASHAMHSTRARNSRVVHCSVRPFLSPFHFVQTTMNSGSEACDWAPYKGEEMLGQELLRTKNDPLWQWVGPVVVPVKSSALP